MSTAPDPSATPYTGSTTGEVTIPSEDATITSITPVPSNTTTQYLTRRLRRVLFDLGLDQKVGSWITPSQERLEFASLSIQQADALVLVLEDVVAGRKRTGTRRPGTNQLRLF